MKYLLLLLSISFMIGCEDPGACARACEKGGRVMKDYTYLDHCICEDKIDSCQLPEHK